MEGWIGVAGTIVAALLAFKFGRVNLSSWLSALLGPVLAPPAFGSFDGLGGERLELADEFA